MPGMCETFSANFSVSASITAGSGPSSDTKIGWLPSVASMPGIGLRAWRIAFSTSFWLRFRSCGLVSWIDRLAELRLPLPVSPMVVEIMRISGIVLIASSTWTSFSLPRGRLVPTGSSTLSWM